MSTIGFIGSGNIGSAMIGGLIKSEQYKASNIFIFDLDKAKTKQLREKEGVNLTINVVELCEKSDYIVLAIKPNVYNVVLEEIKAACQSQKVIVSIAAGKSIDDISNILGDHAKIVRAMPNTPALVNEGMTAICCNRNVSTEQLNEAKAMFMCLGSCEVVSESLFSAVIGVSGSSPAYAFMFIEALADSAVLAGIPRDMAYRFASQALLGSAKMVLESGKHPAELKDMVCSPGGTTIEAVAQLEASGFRGSVIEAVSACVAKAEKMK